MIRDLPAAVSPLPLSAAALAEKEHNASREIQHINNNVHNDGNVDVPFPLYDQSKRDQSNYTCNGQPGGPNVEQCKQGSVDRGCPKAEA